MKSKAVPSGDDLHSAIRRWLVAHETYDRMRTGESYGALCDSDERLFLSFIQGCTVEDMRLSWAFDEFKRVLLRIREAANDQWGATTKEDH